MIAYTQSASPSALQELLQCRGVPDLLPRMEHGVMTMKYVYYRGCENNATFRLR